MEDVHDSHSVVVENSWDIFRWEFVCCVADEEACLADGAVADNNAPAMNGEGQKTGVSRAFKIAFDVGIETAIALSRA